jgi:hypothetical protein
VEAIDVQVLVFHGGELAPLADRLHLPQCVADLGRPLVVHGLGGLPHLPLEMLDERIVPPGKEEPRLAHGLVVGQLGGQPGRAGAEAAVHVVVQARPRQGAVDLDPADPDLEQLLDQLDGLAGQPPGQERAVVLGAVVADAAGEGDAGELLLEGQLQVGIGLVVPQQDVVPGALALDPVVFEKERLGLRVRHHKLQVHGLGHHGGEPGLVVPRQVGRRPLAQGLRLAHVEHLPGRVLEDVDAGTVGKLPDALCEVVVLIGHDCSRRDIPEGTTG